MLIGIIGAPNKGKSTIFSALTMASAEIADYPFTTIKPNLGVAYATRQCVEKELHVKCKPRNGLCINGVREIPINITDVAGLVPDAHLGKGMGNQFLSDLAGASAFIQVVDLSGKTDIHGNAGEGYDPAEEVLAVRKEVALWLAGIIVKHKGALSKRNDGEKALVETLTGFGLKDAQVRKAAEACGLGTSQIAWDEKEAYAFADKLLAISKPTVVAANKLDMANPEALERLRKKLDGYTVIGCSGAVELALRKAAAGGIIDYAPGSAGFEVKREVGAEQKKALDYMSDFVKKNGGTGVQEVIDTVVFKELKEIVVYPVEDENKYTDHFGNVLPDALLVTKGSKAVDLAEAIHSDLAKGMLYAIDAKKKLRVAKDYALTDNDVLRIVSAAK
ncbi:MAG: YchF-related putative GTPase [Candidatus Marsarchaeota archaeon]|nr:YchF-related putative GTPase [Candidatus Marsarchaeota archaeon]